MAISCNRNSGGVLAAVFKTAQAIDDYRHNPFLPYITNNSTHKFLPYWKHST
jgi:hypothetical protein